MPTCWLTAQLAPEPARAGLARQPGTGAASHGDLRATRGLRSLPAAGRSWNSDGEVGVLTASPKSHLSLPLNEQLIEGRTVGFSTLEWFPNHSAVAAQRGYKTLLKQ